MTATVYSTLVMTVIGPDRPGLVETLADSVKRCGGNWLESRMAHLAGEFAGILRVEVPTEAVDGLLAEFSNLKQQGLHITVQADDSHD